MSQNQIISEIYAIKNQLSMEPAKLIELTELIKFHKEYEFPDEFERAFTECSQGRKNTTTPDALLAERTRIMDCIRSLLSIETNLDWYELRASLKLPSAVANTQNSAKPAPPQKSQTSLKNPSHNINSAKINGHPPSKPSAAPINDVENDDDTTSLGDPIDWEFERIDPKGLPSSFNGHTLTRISRKIIPAF